MHADRQAHKKADTLLQLQTALSKDKVKAYQHSCPVNSWCLWAVKEEAVLVYITTKNSFTSANEVLFVLFVCRSPFCRSGSQGISDKLLSCQECTTMLVWICRETRYLGSAGMRSPLGVALLWLYSVCPLILCICPRHLPVRESCWAHFGSDLPGLWCIHIVEDERERWSL